MLLTSYNEQDNHPPPTHTPTTKNYPAQNVNSVKVEKPCIRG